MADVYALFWDGPCAKKTRRLNPDDYIHVGKFHYPDFLTCGGVYYVRGTAPDDSSPIYFVLGGKYAGTAEQIRGEQDMFVAWHRLNKALGPGTERVIQRIRNARRRMARAVR